MIFILHGKNTLVVSFWYLHLQNTKTLKWLITLIHLFKIGNNSRIVSNSSSTGRLVCQL